MNSRKNNKIKNIHMNWRNTSDKIKGERVQN